MGSLTRLVSMVLEPGGSVEDDELLREYEEHEKEAMRIAAELAKEKKEEPPPLDMHSHQCTNCYYMWKHSGRRANRASKEEMKKMHSCPKCGTEQWLRYTPTRYRW
jgi:predicted Zn-ribbon and HTH transcriptional regulator